MTLEIVEQVRQVNVIKKPNIVEISDVGKQGVPGAPSTVPGPQGPQGPQGLPGNGIPAFLFTQNTPAAVWTITHNLGYRPNVAVVDSSDSVVEGDITYLSDAVVEIAFRSAFSGSAYLS